MEPFTSRRSTYTLLILGFIVSALLFTVSAVKQRQDTRQRAAAATSLTLLASSTNVSVNDEVTINVQMNTGVNLVTAAEVEISFDTTVFSGISIEKGPFADSTLGGDGTITGGKARIVVSNGTQNPKQGTGTIAILRLRALRAINYSQINFTPKTAVAAVGEDASVLASSGAVGVTVWDGNASPAPSPTIAASPTSAPSPTLIPSATPLASATPQPSPSASPIPSATPAATPAVSAETTLFFQPSSYTVTPNSTLLVPVYINTGNNEVVGADITVQFDSTYFEGVAVSPGGFLPEIFPGTNISGNQIHVTVGSPNNQARNGQGSAVVLELRAKSTLGTSTLQFDANTRVSALNTGQNILRTVGNGYLTVSESTSIGGTSYNNTTTSTCSTVATPTGLYGTAISGSQVTLYWNQVSNADHYGIVYGTKSGVYTWGAANIGNTSSFTVGNLTSGVSYYFAVFAVNECGDSSDFSSGTLAKTQSPTGGSDVGYVYVAPSPTPSLYGPSPTPDSSIGYFEPVDPNESASEFVYRTATQSGIATLPQITFPSGTPEASPEASGSGVTAILSQVAKIPPFIIMIIIFVFLLMVGFILFRRRNV
ncbi:hypothetical protein C4579_02340 [Candidatus Microgenomates bacterium]|nr:MAG: hypothetical protein C4579_02340 [Candidatus Microgenomates bacterium]